MSTGNPQETDLLIRQTELGEYIDYDTIQSRNRNRITQKHRSGASIEPGEWTLNLPIPVEGEPLVIPAARSPQVLIDEDPPVPSALNGPDALSSERVSKDVASARLLFNSSLRVWRARRDAMNQSSSYSQYTDLLVKYMGLRFCYVVACGAQWCGFGIPKKIEALFRDFMAPVSS